MSNKPIKTDDFRAFIRDVKQRIQAAQIKAAVAVNQKDVFAQQAASQFDQALIRQQLVAQFSWGFDPRRSKRSWGG